MVLDAELSENTCIYTTLSFSNCRYETLRGMQILSIQHSALPFARWLTMKAYFQEQFETHAISKPRQARIQRKHAPQRPPPRLYSTDYYITDMPVPTVDFCFAYETCGYISSGLPDWPDLLVFCENPVPLGSLQWSCLLFGKKTAVPIETAKTKLKIVVYALRQFGISLYRAFECWSDDWLVWCLWHSISMKLRSFIINSHDFSNNWSLHEWQLSSCDWKNAWNDCQVGVSAFGELVAESRSCMLYFFSGKVAATKSKVSNAIVEFSAGITQKAGKLTPI